MGYKEDILAREQTPEEKAEAEALAKDQQAAHGAPPASGKTGDEIILLPTGGPADKNKPSGMYGKHTGLHYNGKGQDGQTFQDVWGPRKDKQRMDKPAGDRGESGIVRSS
jgi:hypothetical protein